MIFNKNKLVSSYSYYKSCSVNNEGVFIGPTHGSLNITNFAWVPHTFGGVWPSLISHTERDAPDRVTIRSGENRVEMLRNSASQMDGRLEAIL